MVKANEDIRIGSGSLAARIKTNCLDFTLPERMINNLDFHPFELVFFQDIWHGPKVDFPVA